MNRQLFLIAFVFVPFCFAQESHSMGAQQELPLHFNNPQDGRKLPILLASNREKKPRSEALVKGQDYKVVKVTYGDDDRREDVTDIFRERALLHENFFYFDVGYREIGKDPAPGRRKHVLIDITFKNEETKTLRFDDGNPAFYTTWSPVENFTILAAYWGGGGKFLDVREHVLRALVLQDGLEATNKSLGDPEQSRHRKLFVVYSRGKYIHILQTFEGGCFTAENILHDDFDIEAAERQLRKIKKTR